MDAVTYPDSDVQQLIENYFVPVQFNVKDQPQVMQEFHTPWTPTLMVQDGQGTEHRRSQGYLDPTRFIAEMSLARLKSAIDAQDFQSAASIADETLQAARGDDEREPEALYWSAVARYKASEDPQNLLNGWNRLLDEFPDSEWARKASFIRD